MNSVNWTEIIERKLKAWWVYVVDMLPNFLLALLVLVLFFIAGRVIRNLSRRFILRVSKSASLTGLLSGVIYTFVIIAGIMTSLDILELDKTVSSLLAGVGIIGLALGFAFQDLTANFISGAFIVIRRPFDVGHIVETNGFTGKIEEIQLRSTTLRTSAGLHVIIPNKDVFQKPIINYSRTHERRVEIDFVIPNTIDIIFVQKIIRTVIAQIAARNAIRKYEFYYTAIENPNIRINVSFWTSLTDPQFFLRVKHKAIASIYKAFAENKIYKVQVPEVLEKPASNEQKA